MDREQISVLLAELADELESVGARGEMLLVGGAAMALAYSSRRVTADLDAIFEPKQIIYDAADRVGAHHGLDPGWLNDAVKAFAPGRDPNATVFFDRPGLVVRLASPRYLLAMKLLASRVERDEDDITLLLRLAGIDSLEAAMELVASVYPAAILTPKVRLLVEELLEERRR